MVDDPIDHPGGMRDRTQRQEARAGARRLRRPTAAGPVTWPARLAALMDAQVAAEVEKQSGKPVVIEAAILQKVLETCVRAKLDALADLCVSPG